MTFTNISSAGVYMQCCHREVEPGGSFILPWAIVKRDRGLRSAMNSGVLSWESDSEEPHVPGSPVKGRTAAQIRADERAAAERRSEELDRETRLLQRLDAEAVSDNMARMGNFDVPQDVERRGAEVRKVAERPITAADVIGDAGPKSLADIRRHNKAVRRLGKSGK